MDSSAQVTPDPARLRAERVQHRKETTDKDCLFLLRAAMRVVNFEINRAHENGEVNVTIPLSWFYSDVLMECLSYEEFVRYQPKLYINDVFAHVRDELRLVSADYSIAMDHPQHKNTFYIEWR